MATRWYDDSQLSRGFIAAMIEAGMEEPADIQSVLKSPQKFNSEYDAWEEAGFPDAEGDDGWEDFVQAVTSGDGEAS